RRWPGAICQLPSSGRDLRVLGERGPSLPGECRRHRRGRPDPQGACDPSGAGRPWFRGGCAVQRGLQATTEGAGRPAIRCPPSRREFRTRIVVSLERPPLAVRTWLVKAPVTAMRSSSEFAVGPVGWCGVFWDEFATIILPWTAGSMAARCSGTLLLPRP